MQTDPTPNQRFAKKKCCVCVRPCYKYVSKVGFVFLEMSFL